MIPAERVAAGFRRFRVEEYPREVTPSGFNAGQGRALVRYHQDVKAGLKDRAFVGRRENLVAARCFLQARRPS
jgi:hypothetical protein